MKLTKSEYEEMIRKKPSLKPTEEKTFEKELTEKLRAINAKIGPEWESPTNKSLLEAANECLESNGSHGPIVQENASLVLKTHQIRPSKDEDKLNKTEKAWLAELRIRRPKFLGIQALTFKLGDDCRYTPDFIEISQEDKFIAWEVKGFMRDDALVKLKVSARLFPFLEFYVVKRSEGMWKTTKIDG